MSITRLSGGSSLNSNLPCSVPLSDVMAPLLRMCDQTEVSKMNSQMTASYIDQNVSDLMITSEWGSNPLQGSKGVDYDGVIQPRGTIRPSYGVVLHTIAATADAAATTDESLISTA